MNFETNRLIVTEITPEDIQDIHEMHLYPEVAQFNTIGIPKDISETQNLLQSIFEDQKKEPRTNYGCVIRSKETREFIGELGMTMSSKKYSSGEIRYGLQPIYWGNGYAIEAVKGVINFGFNHLNLHRIVAGVAVGNDRSISLLEKVGMRKEGHHRKILPLQTGWTDNLEYAILKEDKRDY